MDLLLLRLVLRTNFSGLWLRRVHPAGECCHQPRRRRALSLGPELRKTASRAGRGNEQTWVPWCEPPGTSLEGSQQPPAARRARWATAGSRGEHPPPPPTEAKGGRRMLKKGRGIKTARRHVATPALSHFHWRKQDGGNKNKKKKKEFKCTSTRHKAVCHSPGSGGTLTARILLLNALTNLRGLI